MGLAADIDVSRQMRQEGRDIPWLLAQWVERTPDKPFLIWEPFDDTPQTWTYADLDREVKSVAGYLHANGVAKGDRVLVHLDNCPEFVITWFACARVGAVAVSTNTRSVARDMLYFAEHAGVVAAITQPCFAELVRDTAPMIKFLAVTDNDAGKAADVPANVDHVPFQALRDHGEDCPARPTEPMANLGIQFTSGTTSRPKAVLWTHANAIWGAELNALHMKLVHDDITQTFMPIFHTNAQSYSMLGSMWVGGTMVLQPKFSASRFWDVAVRNKCTWASQIPFSLKAILQQPIPDNHCFRFWGAGARLVDAEKLCGIKTIGWWGMTETITQGIVGDVDFPGPDLSIGRVSPGYEVLVKHQEEDRPIRPGERGHLYVRGVRGVALFKEYFGNPEANEKAFDADGWFDTGDLIRMDEDGYLFFGDRDKDMLKIGAENVAASEIETVIMETGLVDECAVVAQKHYMLDEVPVVFVTTPGPAPADLKEKLIATCQENLADFKVVRDVIHIDEFPRSTLEKIAKAELRKRLPAIEA